MYPYLMDSDHISLIDRAGSEGARRLRVGTMDLKIAATALANEATLVTRNTADFGKVLGLNMEDWSGE